MCKNIRGVNNAGGCEMKNVLKHHGATEPLFRPLRAHAFSTQTVKGKALVGKGSVELPSILPDLAVLLAYS